MTNTGVEKSPPKAECPSASARYACARVAPSPRPGGRLARLNDPGIVRIAEGSIEAARMETFKASISRPVNDIEFRMSVSPSPRPGSRKAHCPDRVPATVESSSADQYPVRTDCKPFLREEPQSFERQTLRYPAYEQSRNVLSFHGDCVRSTTFDHDSDCGRAAVRHRAECIYNESRKM
jgi:hypothetical protein